MSSPTSQLPEGATFKPTPDGVAPPTNIVERDVAWMKKQIAGVVDMMSILRCTTGDPDVKRAASLAINDAEAAGMWAVSALTMTPVPTAETAETAETTETTEALEADPTTKAFERANQ